MSSAINSTEDILEKRYSTGFLLLPFLMLQILNLKFTIGHFADNHKDNYLIMTERIKDLFKTSNGKYIAPQEIETRLILDKYIEQAAVIGDERNFVTAIIAPTIPEVEKFAKANKINYSSMEELLKQPEIYNLIMGRIKVLQSGMAEYEKIMKFTLIPKSFSIEAGELTNTLKVRRAVIMQKYKLQIEEMYAV